MPRGSHIISVLKVHEVARRVLDPRSPPTVGFSPVAIPRPSRIPYQSPRGRPEEGRARGEYA